ncbi:hypothetical protein SLEP1_g45706 [Rubroshorea leprosula]|uniref:porphobilinogen synthase n=1 Tax=Rubroshorea leprosula TaxID=152421 RepID=A0AAV5LJX6_9ROSI|nr:hypothetical protein SLEP1_g45706 [Rubroshorea leprosula]
MVSMMVNSHYTVPSIKGFDIQNHVGVRSTSTLRFNAGEGLRRRPFVVRASESRDGHVKKMGMSVAQCEAAVVSGNVHEAPPVPPTPAVPTGTPGIQPLQLNRRPRRNRKSTALRKSFQEANLSPANFIYPLFIHEGEEDTPIGAMPGCYRLGWRHGLVEEVRKARDVGVNNIMLFPKVPDALKSPTGDEAYDDNGLVPRAIRLLKDKYPDLVIYTDVALDPYSSGGHDGIVREDVIINDEMVYQLCKQAVSQARAGADVISPSDMMDGRVAADMVVVALMHGELVLGIFLPNTIIANQTMPFRHANSFYGPFHEAINSSPCFGDKRMYQMNPANYREALIEAREDEAEGADILLARISPFLGTLDVIKLLKDKFHLPIAAYQVSGEYSIIKAGGLLKMIDEEKVMIESLICLRRAGAGIILTYFALAAARRLWGEKN